MHFHNVVIKSGNAESTHQKAQGGALTDFTQGKKSEGQEST